MADHRRGRAVHPDPRTGLPRARPSPRPVVAGLLAVGFVVTGGIGGFLAGFWFWVGFRMLVRGGPDHQAGDMLVHLSSMAGLVVGVIAGIALARVTWRRLVGPAAA